MTAPVDSIRDLEPYVPGKPIEELERELGVRGSLKLASNESALGPSPLALEAIRDALIGLHRYPDGGAYELVAALAGHLGVERSQVVLGNGSDEVIALVLHAFCPAGGVIATSAQGFLMYKLFAKSRGIGCVEAPLRARYRYDLPALADLARTTRASAVFLANPSNPTGQLVTHDEIVELSERLGADTILVLDEAYREYATSPDAPRSIELVATRPATIVLRTFSKAYGLAGIRVGYGVASPGVADYLNRVRLPFNVNRLAQVAACAALKDEAHLKAVLRTNREGKAQLAKGLDQLGLRYPESEANFYLVDLERPARPVYEALLRKGLIVRPMNGYGYPDHIRITIGTREENERVLAGLGEVLG